MVIVMQEYGIHKYDMRHWYDLTTIQDSYKHFRRLLFGMNGANIYFFLKFLFVNTLTYDGGIRTLCAIHSHMRICYILCMLYNIHAMCSYILHQLSALAIRE